MERAFVSGQPSPVHVEEADGITTVVLDDPGARNALSWELVRALSEAVEEAAARGARALVLRNTPPVFCAGGSVDELLDPKVPLEEIYRAFHALDRAPMPTVAAIDGAAVGAGMTLFLCCDVAICTPESRFDVRFLDVGIHPGGGALWRLGRVMGPQGAAALSLFGEVLVGEEAERRGLVWRCVPAGELTVEAGRLARTAASRDPELVTRTKRTLLAAATVDDQAAAIELELAAQRWSMERPAFQESLAELRARLGRPAT
jgi:enoyl-CoA hydratase/carnithine racemase